MSEVFSNPKKLKLLSTMSEISGGLGSTFPAVYEEAAVDNILRHTVHGAWGNTDRNVCDTRDNKVHWAFHLYWIQT
jgi:hypothetical protein